MRRRTRSVPLAAAIATTCCWPLLTPVAGSAQDIDVQPADRMAAEADRNQFENEPDDPLAAGRSLYVAGNGHLKRGDKLAAKAAKVGGAERSELESKAREEREAAVEALGEAVRTAPGLLDAYVSLGTALRALGRAEEALQVHALALQRNERDDDNFRGYVVSLLALDRLGNAAALYEQMKQEQPKRAKIVYEELSDFYDERKSEPGNLAPADLERLASWLAERRTG